MLKTIISKEYHFRGEHASMVRKLTGKDSKFKIFSTSIELFIFSAVVGCCFNVTAKPQKGENSTAINPTELSSHSDEIEKAMKFILLTCNSLTGKTVKINRAFRNRDTEENAKLFEEYMLGGLVYLHDHLCINSNMCNSDYISSLTSLIEKVLTRDDSLDDVLDTSSLFD